MGECSVTISANDLIKDYLGSDVDVSAFFAAFFARFDMGRIRALANELGCGNYKEPTYDRALEFCLEYKAGLIDIQALEPPDPWVNAALTPEEESALDDALQDADDDKGVEW